MQVNINPKQAAKTIAAFVKEKGGTARHSETLELVASLLGFAEYRALVAAEKAASSPTAPAPTNEPFEQELVDWWYGQNPEATLEKVPEYRRKPYTLRVERTKACVYVQVVPKDQGLRNDERAPALGVMVEINDGVPCVHLNNDSQSDMLMSVFAHEDGLFVRPDGDGLVPTRMAQGDLALLAQRNAGRQEGAVVYSAYQEEPSSTNSPGQVADDSSTDDVVESIVENLQGRASRHGFALGTRDEIRDLLEESAEVLGLQPSDAQYERALDRLAG